MATAVTFKIGAPATITVDLGASFQPSDDKVRAIVQNALYPQFVKVSKVSRRWGSENFTITFLPRRSMSTREWESLFTKTLRAGGYSSAYMVDLTGGTESRDPGGLLSATTSMLTEVGETPIIAETLSTTKWVAIAAAGLVAMYFLPKPKWGKG